MIELEKDSPLIMNHNLMYISKRNEETQHENSKMLRPSRVHGCTCTILSMAEKSQREKQSGACNLA